MATQGPDYLVARVSQALYARRRAHRAPPKITATIAACAQNPDNNLTKLLGRSLRAWFLALMAIENDAAIAAVLEECRPSDMDAITHGLDGIESASQLFQHTFHTSQRAKERQSEHHDSTSGPRTDLSVSLVNGGFGASIPDHIRLSKRPRLGEPDLLRRQSASPESASPGMHLSAESPNMTLDAAASPCEETLRPQPDSPAVSAQSEASRTAQAASGHHQRPHWPKASVLPLVFPQRTCDGVVKEDALARIAVRSTEDPARCSLDIDVTKKMASIVAKELFDMCIRYNEQGARWILELPDGTDVSIGGHFELERAQTPGIEALLGSLVCTTLQNSPQRNLELARGEALTRLLTLSLNGRADASSQLRVMLDAEMLPQLERQLWVP